MTLKELAQAILALPEEEQIKSALHVEPYDDEAQVSAVGLHQATESITDPEGEVRLIKGDWYIQ